MLFIGAMVALMGVICIGICTRFRAGRVASSRGSQRSAARVAGLSQATLIATYDYWGYYNIMFLGSEVRQPERTIPRAILLSVLFVAAFYVAMNFAALPAIRAMAGSAASGSANAVHLQLAADCGLCVWRVAGRVMAALVVWTAFAPCFLFCWATVECRSRPPGTAISSAALEKVHPKQWDPAPVAGGTGTGGYGILFLFPAAGHHDAGDHAHPVAIFPAADGCDRAARQAAGAEEAVSHPSIRSPPIVAMIGLLLHADLNRRHALLGIAVGARHCLQRKPDLSRSRAKVAETGSLRKSS